MFRVGNCAWECDRGIAVRWRRSEELTGMKRVGQAWSLPVMCTDSKLDACWLAAILPTIFLSTHTVPRERGDPSPHLRVPDSAYCAPQLFSKKSKINVDFRFFIRRFITRKSCLRHSGMARVSTQFYLPLTRLSTSGMNYTYLYSHNRGVSQHFGLYSFSVPLRVEGWVGASGWLQTEVV